MINISRRSFLALPAVAAAATFARPALALSDAQNLVEKSRLAFLDMITDDNYKEMRDYVKQARALIIFPELIKGAFIIGAEGGSNNRPGASGLVAGLAISSGADSVCDSGVAGKRGR